jgi:hypothetical protein
MTGNSAVCCSESATVDMTACKNLETARVMSRFNFGGTLEPTSLNTEAPSRTIPLVSEVRAQLPPVSESSIRDAVRRSPRCQTQHASRFPLASLSGHRGITGVVATKQTVTPFLHSLNSPLVSHCHSNYYICPSFLPILQSSPNNTSLPQPTQRSSQNKMEQI